MVKKPQKTAQRIAVMNYLKKNISHPTITDIYKAVSRKLTTISLTTIYNTMNLLKEEGLVRELPAISGHGVRFDPNLTPHHHLICNVCGTFSDVDLRDFHHSMWLSEEQRQGFDIQKISIKLYGVCPQCRNLESRQKIGLN
jgi:Fur family transcriptional regulator, peroxide stress response regulator